MAATQKTAYRLIRENVTHDGAKKSFEDSTWANFLSETSYGSVVVDLENAYNKYLAKLMEGCPGIDILPQAKIRPDLEHTKFISSTVTGKHKNIKKS